MSDSEHAGRADEAPDGARDGNGTHPGAAAPRADEPNRLLAALASDDYRALLPQLTPVRLRLRDVLVEPEQPLEHVYFVREGVGSMLAVEQEGGEVEVGTIGREGFVGLPLLHDAETSSYRVIVQVEGDAWRMGTL